MSSLKSSVWTHSLHYANSRRAPLIRTLVILLLLLSSSVTSEEKQPARPSYHYDVARAHEIKPHLHAGFNQLHITLTVSPSGDVMDVDAGGDREALKFWPQLQDEVRQWRFTPFEENGKAVTALVEEYIDLVPPWNECQRVM